MEAVALNSFIDVSLSHFYAYMTASQRKCRNQLESFLADGAGIDSVDGALSGSERPAPDGQINSPIMRDYRTPHQFSQLPTREK